MSLRWTIPLLIVVFACNGSNIKESAIQPSINKQNHVEESKKYSLEDFVGKLVPEYLVKDKLSTVFKGYYKSIRLDPQV